MSDLEWGIVWLTVRVSTIGTLTTLPIAIWVGFLLARKDIPGKPLLEGLISLPLVAPPVVTGYMLLLCLGQNGVVGRWLYEVFGLKLTFNFTALVVASVAVSLPLATRSIRASFELVDPAYEKVSRTLGAPRMAGFFKVSLPMALPGILSGAVLAFARSLGEFGATITLAGNISGRTQTISMMVYSNMQVPGMELQVTRLVSISVLISLAAIAASELIGKRRAYVRRWNSK